MKISRIILIDSLKVTAVVSFIIILCSMLGDVTAIPAQIALGGTDKQIHDSQNMTFLFAHPFIIILSIFGTYAFSVLGLSYLHHGEF